jgi:hypothetical protein
MEPSGRNQWQPVANRNAAKRLKQAKIVATGCDRLPIGAHGKEGVDGSSPSEGSAKVPQIRDFPFRIGLHVQQPALGMEPIMEPSDLEAPCEAGVLVSY